MEVRIGVVQTARELVVETAQSPDEVADAVAAAVGTEGGALWLTDTKGKRVCVPSAKIAYVEVASDAGERQVGFGIR